MRYRLGCLVDARRSHAERPGGRLRFCSSVVPHPTELLGNTHEITHKCIRVDADKSTPIRIGTRFRSLCASLPRRRHLTDFDLASVSLANAARLPQLGLRRGGCAASPSLHVEAGRSHDDSSLSFGGCNTNFSNATPCCRVWRPRRPMSPQAASTSACCPAPPPRRVRRSVEAPGASDQR